MNSEEKRHRFQRKCPKIYEVLKNIVLILVFNFFCYIIFSMFISGPMQTAAHKNFDNSAQVMVMVFSTICYVALFITYLLIYKKNSVLQRQLQAKAKLGNFKVRDFYIDFMKKTFWAVPLTVALLLLPFTIYYSAGGFGYEIGIFFEYLFSPQMLFYELTKIPFLAWFLNIIVFSLFSYITQFLAFLTWYKDYKDVHSV